MSKLSMISNDILEDFFLQKTLKLHLNLYNQCKLYVFLFTNVMILNYNGYFSITIQRSVMCIIDIRSRMHVCIWMCGNVPVCSAHHWWIEIYLEIETKERLRQTHGRSDIPNDKRQCEKKFFYKENETIISTEHLHRQLSLLTSPVLNWKRTT